MPIRFRCAYCSQLMGIARRKSGTVVRCPKCSGQVVVPAASEPGASVTPPPPSDPRPAAPVQSAPRSAFEFSDVEVIVTPSSTGDIDESIDVVPLSGPGPISGYFVSTTHLLLGALVIFGLLVAAFFLGWFLRGQ